MRIYETARDMYVLPESFFVVRLDGRGFTKLTKKKHPFEAPFDERFRDMMVETTLHLMKSGFKVIYGFTESDEISLLFDINENLFGRKHRKYISVLAGEASAKFSLLLGDIGVFDGRISELSNPQLVVDYFRWRNEDAFRNALNAHCYWMLRKNNYSRGDATRRIDHMSTAEKNELLFSYGINFNNLPNWQKRGIGVYWKDVEKEGINPIFKIKTITLRKGLHVDYELPMKSDYSRFLENIIAENSNPKE